MKCWRIIKTNWFLIFGPINTSQFGEFNNSRRKLKRQAGEQTCINCSNQVKNYLILIWPITRQKENKQITLTEWIHWEVIEKKMQNSIIHFAVGTVETNHSFKTWHLKKEMFCECCGWKNVERKTCWHVKKRSKEIITTVRPKWIEA